MKKRHLGSSAVQVSEIGLGCNRIGEKSLSDSEWIKLLQHAAYLGVTIFDTAAFYTHGHSEELIGQAFGNRDDIVIASKVSPVRDSGNTPFSRDTVIAGAEKSLKALRRDCIDIFQTHGSGNLAELSNPEWSEAMLLLQQQGKIRFRGAAVFDAEGAIYAIENNLVDVLQITYNLIDTSHALPILPVADRHGVGLLARMPYQRGILTGKFASPEADVGDHRAKLQGDRFPADVRAAEQYRDLGSKRPGGMAELAMQFVLMEKRISCTIPGARTIQQLEANIAAATAQPLTDEEIQAIAAIRD